MTGWELLQTSLGRKSTSDGELLANMVLILQVR